MLVRASGIGQFAYDGVDAILEGCQIDFAVLGDRLEQNGLFLLDLSLRDRRQTAVDERIVRILKVRHQIAVDESPFCGFGVEWQFWLAELLAMQVQLLTDLLLRYISAWVADSNESADLVENVELSVALSLFVELLTLQGFEVFLERFLVEPRWPRLFQIGFDQLTGVLRRA